MYVYSMNPTLHDMEDVNTVLWLFTIYIQLFISVFNLPEMAMSGGVNSAYSL